MEPTGFPDKAPPDPAGLSHSGEYCAPGARKWLLASAVLASSMGFIDGTVVSIALPAMRADLGASLVAAQWISNGYLLMVAALILTGGALSDRFGLRVIFGGGIVFFVLASVLCALAPDARMLIAARVLQGAGAAMMVPGSLSLITRAYPPAERARAIGTWAAASALTTALGPILGSLLLTYGTAGSWRWIFAVNLPMGALALWLLVRNAGQRPERDRTPPDALGAVLITLALFSIAWGLSASAGEGEIPQVSPVWLVAGSALLAGFLWWEARHPAPMLPLSLFASPVFSAVNAASFALYVALTAMMFFLPMAVIGGWNATPVDAALAFAPLSVFISTLSRPVGGWTDRFGPGPMIGAGAALVALAYGWVAFTAGAAEYWRLTFPGMVFAGLGMALVVAPLSVAVMAAVPAQRSGTASGVNNAVTRMSSVVAVAGAGTLAGWAYSEAGGPLSFGAVADGMDHRAASSLALAWVAGVSAALAGISSVMALLLLPRGRQSPAP